ncbi:MAG: hypothetical protein ACRENE_29940 [Polyangiaceae bacterium]
MERFGPPSPLRIATLALAFAHTFPARKHLVAFALDPSVSEGWKAFGAAIAVGLYLLPVRLQARGLGALWRHRSLLKAMALGLVAVHAVPLSDHLPRFVASGAWADAWRGMGSALAIVWFVTPVSQQAAVLSALRRLFGRRAAVAIGQSKVSPA